MLGESTGAEHFECQRNGGQGTYEQERPADGLTLAFGQTVRQQETDPGAEHRTCAGDQGELRESDSGFSHGNGPLESLLILSAFWRDACYASSTLPRPALADMLQGVSVSLRQAALVGVEMDVPRLLRDFDDLHELLGG